MIKIFKYLILIVILLFPVYFLHADAASDLQDKINERNNQIKQLEAQINQYNQAVNDAGSQAKTLQNTLKTLDLTQKKITTDLTLTDKKITVTNLTISQIQDEVTGIVKSVDQNKSAIRLLINEIRINDESQTMLSSFLSGKNITDVWTDIETTREVQHQIKIKSDELRLLKSSLDTQETSLDTQQKQLVSLKQDLNGKKQAIESTKQEKATILAETKNKEQTYKTLLKTTEEKKAQFEKDVFDFESQLHLLIDKGSYPSPHFGILSWPLDDPYITQKFGKTVGAEKLYVSGSHNGVDFRASIGTRVKNVLDGEVVGTGNTDIFPGCYSFGKWVMVKHGNGLSTIYGHLSVISVNKGDELKTGDLIGYSGNTGYSTGPHLHISVYATQGVKIEQFVNSRGCKQAIIPLADVKAYLDPLGYFPQI